jgi:hypothetical protein
MNELQPWKSQILKFQWSYTNEAYDLQVAWIHGPAQRNLLGSGVRVLHDAIDALTSAGATLCAQGQR